MNRVVLKYKIDLDFVLIAVTSSLKDYRICYLINKHLNFNFTRADDHTIDLLADAEPVYFSFFEYFPDEDGAEFYFITNKGSEGLLVPEMREVDYFMIIKNYIENEEVDQLVTSLNRIPEIVAAVKIDPKKIKSRENLLF